MLIRTATWRSSRLVSGLALLAFVLVACSPEHYPQTTLIPRGDFARIADNLLGTTVKWALLVFVLVEGVLIYAIFRFRGKPGDPEPHQTHGNTTVEIIWTVIPALILAAIAVPTVRAIFQTSAIPGKEALTIEVVGHQWWWEVRYPEYNLTTANELHVPVGRTVSLRMGSADVIHSFWVPQFAGKRDVFANRETRLWFKAEVEGSTLPSAVNSAESNTLAWHTGSRLKNQGSFRPGSPICRRSDRLHLPEPSPRARGATLLRDRPPPGARPVESGPRVKGQRFSSRVARAHNTRMARSCLRPRAVSAATRFRRSMHPKE